MFLVKNALYNIKRHKIRFLMIGFIIFVIILLSSISIILHSTAEEIKQDYIKRFGVPSYLVTQEGKKANIPVRQLLDFGNSDHLLKSEYLSTNMYVFTKLFPLDKEEENSFLIGSESEFSPHGYLFAMSNSDISEEFKNGKKKIIEGNRFKKKRETIISKELAKLNHLRIGDEIEITNIEKKSKETYTLKIVGIYEDYEVNEQAKYKTALSNRGNQIYTSFETILEMKGLFENGKIEAKFYLKSTELLEKWEEEIRAKGLDVGLKVITDTVSYQKILAPIEGMNHIATLFLKMILILGSVILLLLSIMTIRERKYEVGVLRCMGMKRLKIAINFILENLVITIFCLVLGLGTANIIGTSISNYFIQSQIHLVEKKEETNNALSNIEVKLNKEDTIKIIFISLLLIGSSSITSIIVITKYEPKEILSQTD